MTRTIFLFLVCAALLPSQSRFDVVEATIPEMRAAMEQKRITSRELVVFYLTRIDPVKQPPIVNAIARLLLILIPSSTW